VCCSQQLLIYSFTWACVRKRVLMPFKVFKKFSVDRIQGGVQHWWLMRNFSLENLNFKKCDRAFIFSGNQQYWLDIPVRF
jgi:hypothetical protein